MRSRQRFFGLACILVSTTGVLGYNFLFLQNGTSYREFAVQQLLMLGILLLGMEQLLQPYRARLTRALFVVGGTLTLLASGLLLAGTWLWWW